MLEALILSWEILNWENFSDLSDSFVEESSDREGNLFNEKSLFSQEELDEVLPWTKSDWQPEKSVKENIKKKAIADTFEMLTVNPIRNPSLKEVFPFAKELVDEFARVNGRNPKNWDEAHGLADTALTNYKAKCTSDFTDSRIEFYSSQEECSYRFEEEYSYLESVKFHNYLVGSKKN